MRGGGRGLRLYAGCYRTDTPCSEALVSDSGSEAAGARGIHPRHLLALIDPSNRCLGLHRTSYLHYGVIVLDCLSLVS